MVMGLATMGWVPFSPLQRSPFSLVAPGASLSHLILHLHLALPPVSKKEIEAGKADKWDWATQQPLASSPLSALTPSLGPGSLHISLKYVESRTPMPGLPLVPLTPLHPLPSPVTLLQVEDIVTISNMVWELHSHHLPPPSLSSSNLPSSSWMAVDNKEDSSLSESCTLSFNPWMESHLAPSITGTPHEWETWLDPLLALFDSPSSLEMAVDAKDSLVIRSHTLSFDLWTETHLVPPVDGSLDSWWTWIVLKHVLGRALESQRTKGDCREAMKTIFND
jgi:hypothetical protein